MFAYFLRTHAVVFYTLSALILMCKAVPVEPSPVDPKNTVPDPKSTAPDPKNTVPDPNNTVPDPKNTVPDPKNTVPDPKNTAPDPKNTDPNPKKDAKDGAGKKGSKKVKFVSMRCGIGGRWNQAAQVCMPYTLDENSASEEDDASTTPTPLEPREKDKPVSEEIVISEERIKWQIVTIMCGIGYRYLKKEKICRAMDYKGHEVIEHKRTNQMDKQNVRRRRSLMFDRTI